MVLSDLNKNVWISHKSLFHFMNLNPETMNWNESLNCSLTLIYIYNWFTLICKGNYDLTYQTCQYNPDILPKSTCHEIYLRSGMKSCDFLLKPGNDKTWLRVCKGNHFKHAEFPIRTCKNILCGNSICQEVRGWNESGKDKPCIKNIQKEPL